MNNTYAKANLFLGDGPRPDHEGRVRFERASITILRGSETSKGWMETPHGEPWLIVARGSFWPVMVRLDPGDIEQLAMAIRRVER